MLGVDVGRPWNFYWVLLPWHWNLHSPLLEIAVCMSLYATVPLFLENLPPLFEYFIYEYPKWRGIAEVLRKSPGEGLSLHHRPRLHPADHAPVFAGCADDAGRQPREYSLADAVACP